MHFNSWQFNLTAKKEGHSVALICTYSVIWIPHLLYVSASCFCSFLYSVSSPPSEKLRIFYMLTTQP